MLKLILSDNISVSYITQTHLATVDILLYCHVHCKHFYTNTVESYLAILYAKQKHLGCNKGKANQKQQLSDYMGT